MSLLLFVFPLELGDSPRIVYDIFLCVCTTFLRVHDHTGPCSHRLQEHAEVYDRKQQMMGVKTEENCFRGVFISISISAFLSGALHLSARW